MLRRKKSKIEFSDYSAVSGSIGDYPVIESTHNIFLHAKNDSEFGADSERHRNLEKVVLGGDKGFLAEKLASASPSASSSDEEEPDVLPVRGSSGAATDKLGEASQALFKPAWIDEDDEKQVTLPSDRKLKHLKLTTDEDRKISGKSYAARLKESFEKASGSLGTPAWAQLESRNKRKRFRDSSSDSEEDVSDLTKKVGNYVASYPYLPRETIQFKRVQDLTFGRRKKKPVCTVEFHKSSRVSLVGSQFGSIALYEVDGESNPLLQNVTFEKFGVDYARFSYDGSKVFVGSRLHSHFYYYDLLDGRVVKIPEIRGMEQTRTDNFTVSNDGKLLAFRGKFGYIHLLSAKSYEWVTSLKMNGEVSKIVFSTADSSIMYSFGQEGQVYIWDTGEQRCIHKFYDDGCVQGSCIAVSDDGSCIATGSNTGVVNVYDSVDVERSEEPKPVKTLMNLTTPVDSLKFSRNGEIMGFASSLKDSASRMLHTGSKTVFTNFPGRRCGVKKVTCLDFSPNSGYCCVGNMEGRAMLFRLQYYKNY